MNDKIREDQKDPFPNPFVKVLATIGVIALLAGAGYLFFKAMEFVW